MDLVKLKKLAREVENELHYEFIDVSDFLFKNPELSEEEYKASNFLANYLKKHGFEVTFPYANLETAFRAEFGEGDEVKIGFLAEYDALPGFGANRLPAHACGHNWVAATAVASAIVLSKLAQNFNGKVIVFGTPAEETVGSKVDMVNQGAFEDIDVVMQAHLEQNTNLYCEALAMDALEFRFKGKATHAASYPHEGINALDGVQLMFAGVNALRQHVKSDVRIHGIITEGGEAPNIVPSNAVCRFYVRAKDRKYLNEVVKKVIRCAEGAAIMTGSQLSYSNFENKFDNIINIPQLQEIFRENLKEQGIFIPEGEMLDLPGSSDVGNVSQVCPTMYLEVDLEGNEPLFVHEESALKLVNSSYAHDKLKEVTNAMVGSALEIYLNKDIIREINKCHYNS
jgi:amidohydrolase